MPVRRRLPLLLIDQDQPRRARRLHPPRLVHRPHPPTAQHDRHYRLAPQSVVGDDGERLESDLGVAGAG